MMGTSACLSVHFNEFGIWSGLMCFFWGWNDGSVNTFLYQILGFEFENHSDVFGAWNFWQGISIFAFELIQGQIGVDSSSNILVYSGICGGLALLCHSHAYFFPFKPHASTGD